MVYNSLEGACHKRYTILGKIAKKSVDYEIEYKKQKKTLVSHFKIEIKDGSWVRVFGRMSGNTVIAECVHEVDALDLMFFSKFRKCVREFYKNNKNIQL